MWDMYDALCIDVSHYLILPMDPTSDYVPEFYPFGLNPNHVVDSLGDAGRIVGTAFLCSETSYLKVRQCQDAPSRPGMEARFGSDFIISCAQYLASAHDAKSDYRWPWLNLAEWWKDESHLFEFKVKADVANNTAIRLGRRNLENRDLFHEIKRRIIAKGEADLINYQRLLSDQVTNDAAGHAAAIRQGFDELQGRYQVLSLALHDAVASLKSECLTEVHDRLVELAPAGFVTGGTLSDPQSYSEFHNYGTDRQQEAEALAERIKTCGETPITFGVGGAIAARLEKLLAWQTSGEPSEG